MVLNYYVIFVLLLIHFCVNCQLSSRGRRFLVAFPRVYEYQYVKLQLIIINNNVLNVSINITSLIEGNSSYINVPANDSSSFLVSSLFASFCQCRHDSVVSNKSLLISSNLPINLYSSSNVNTQRTTILPIKTWGTQYYGQVMLHDNPVWFCYGRQFLILSDKTVTNVTVFIRNPTNKQLETRFDQSLDKFQVLLVMDVEWSYAVEILATYPIGVIAASLPDLCYPPSTSLSIGRLPNFHSMEMLLPIGQWGYEFPVAAVFLLQSALMNDDIYFQCTLTAAFNGTLIKYQNDISSTRILNAGQSLTFYTPGDDVVRANNSVQIEGVWYWANQSGFTNYQISWCLVPSFSQFVSGELQIDVNSGSCATIITINNFKTLVTFDGLPIPEDMWRNISTSRFVSALLCIQSLGQHWIGSTNPKVKYIISLNSFNSETKFCYVPQLALPGELSEVSEVEKLNCRSKKPTGPLAISDYNPPKWMPLVSIQILHEV